MTRWTTLVAYIAIVSLPATAEDQILPPTPYEVAAAYERAVSERLKFEITSQLSVRYSPGGRGPAKPKYVLSFVPELQPGHTGPSPTDYELHVVVRVAATPILHQLDKALQLDAPVGVALRAVAVDQFDVFESSCPAIRAMYNGFPSAAASAFKPNDSQPGFYHGPFYTVAGVSDTTSFTLYVQRGSPLFAWAAQGYLALAACGGG